MLEPYFGDLSMTQTTLGGCQRICRSLNFWWPKHIFIYFLDQKTIKNELQTLNHCVNQLRQQKKKYIKVVTISSSLKMLSRGSGLYLLSI